MERGGGPAGGTLTTVFRADRKGINLYSNPVVALDAATGWLRWHYQMIRAAR